MTVVLNQSVHPGSGPNMPRVRLTAREREILRLMAADLTNAQIAERLVVTTETVRWYTKQIYGKLDAHSRDEALHIAQDLRLLRQPDSASISEEAVPEHPGYIPLPVTPLVGRQTELDDVCGYLLRDDIRLVTLTGPPGIGKTRLSLHVAAKLNDHFADGAFFVALASITDPLHVPGAIAAILNLGAAGTMPVLEMLKNYLRGKHMLLVLDNFEQIMSAVATVAELLVAVTRLKLLVTSREVLRLSSEHQYPLQPLAVPDLRAPLVADDVSHVAAVDLFVQRARAIKHTFTLTDENAPHVARLCARLEGIPLAIELAAARIKLFSPSELLTGVNSRLKLLKANLRDLPSRQQTLRGAIDWSYALLSEDERRLFRRMGVFHGGYTLAAAATVCGAGTDTDVVDLVESLLDKSLLAVREAVGREPRFTILEMLREYVLEKLADTEELSAIQEAHARYYAMMSADAETHWHTPTQAEWLDRLESEIDNIRAALDWCLAHHTELAAQMAVQLWQFWAARGYHSEGDRWYEAVLAQGEQLAPALKTTVLSRSGLFATYTGNLQRAVARLELGEALALVAEDDLILAGILVSRAFAELQRDDSAAAQIYAERALQVASSGDPSPAMQALRSAAHMDLGAALFDQGDHEVGKAHLIQAHAIGEELGDERAIASAKSRLAWRLLLSGERAEAERVARETVALALKHRLHYMLAGASDTLSHVAVHHGDYHAATEYGEQALTLYRIQGNVCYRAACARILGHAYYQLGNRDHAVALLREGFEVARNAAQPSEVAYLLVQAALVLLESGDGPAVGRWLGAAEATLAAIPDVILLERDLYSRALDTFRARLGSEAFEAALAEGRRLTLDQAADEALIYLSAPV